MILIGLLLVLAGLTLTAFSVVRSLRLQRGAPETATAEPRPLIVLAVVAALVPALALSVIRVYSSSTGIGRRLVDVNGVAVLLVLLLPALLAVSPLLARARANQVLLAAGCGTLLAVFCVLGGFSVGSYYLPAAMLLLAASAVGLQTHRTA